MVVLPDTEIAWRNPASFLYGRRFGHDESSSAHGAAPQMHHMPVGGEPVLARILAHRGNGDSIPQRDSADLERREQGHKHYDAMPVAADSRVVLTSARVPEICPCLAWNHNARFLRRTSNGRSFT